MADPYIGEIRMFAGNYAPVGWLFCDGQLLPISGNGALFNVIGTYYGGDGTSNFALPDLRGRAPVHQGNGFGLTSRGGTELVTLSASQIPAHTHQMLGSTALAASNNPQGNIPASLPAGGVASAYQTLQSQVPLDPTTVAPSGGSQPHENMQPYLCLNFIIARVGLTPQPT